MSIPTSGERPEPELNPLILSPLRSVTFIWLDNRGIHLAFFDADELKEAGLLESEGLTGDTLKYAKFICCFSPESAVRHTTGLLMCVHEAFTRGASKDAGPGAPEPFDPNQRLLNAQANSPGLQGQVPDGFDADWWSKWWLAPETPPETPGEAPGEAGDGDADGNL